jgi:hypothetical protein
MFSDTIKPKEIVYPISLSYVPEWGAWEVIRELVSNAIDTRTAWNMTREGDDVVITDSGTGLVIRQLLFGVSEKADSNAIGQFGEGLKLAMLVLTRMGLTARVSSGSLRLWNEVEEIGGEACLKLCFTDNNELFVGTEVFIQGWGAESPIFEERFVSPDSVLFENEKGQLLTDRALFVKGVFVCVLEGYEWGYNLYGVKMNRDRSAISEYDVKNSIASFWRSITNAASWETFFDAVADGAKESEIEIYSFYTPEARIACRDGFYAKHGNNAVIETSMQNATEAKHRRATIVPAASIGYCLRALLAEVVETDEKYVLRKAGEKAFNVPQKNLHPIEKASLQAVKRLAKKLNFNGNIEVFEKEGVGGLWNSATSTIFLHKDSLFETGYAKAVFIHELAHCESGAPDCTDAHMNAACAIAARLAS